MSVLTSSAPGTGARLRWRVVDIVVAAVVAVACGALFVAWNVAVGPVTTPLEALVPGLGALTYGVWLIAGPLVALIVRKPGAALFGELVAAAVSMVLGAQWGLLTLEAGLVQGLAAELVFLAFRYRVWSLPVALLAGAVAGLAMAINDIAIYYLAAGPAFQAIYVVAGVIGGAVIAGLVAWLLVRGLAATGALARFPAGRERTERV
ncbi:MAG: ECF transporter S component [Actinomycetales bacterium]|nr:ECF transporter S component [Actinomycetales bacterium]